MIVELQDYTGGRYVSQSVATTANTWVYRTVTFPADTTGTILNNNTTGLGLNFWIGAGSTYTGGSSLQTTWGTATNTRAVGQTNWAASTSYNVWITGVQLELGDVDTPFEFEPYEETLRKCQRYYYKDPLLVGVGFGFNLTRATAQNPVQMRAVPTMTVSNTVNFWNGAVNSLANAASGTFYNTVDYVQADLGIATSMASSTIGVRTTNAGSPIGTITVDAEL